MFSRSKIRTLVLAMLILPSLSFAQEATNTSTAELGQSKTREVFLVKDVPQTLTFEYEIGEIAVGNPGFVSVIADRPRRRVVLSPLETGETALLVFDTFGKQRDNIQITVTSTDLDQFVKDLRFLFRDIEGLQFRRVGRKVVLEGEVFLKADLDRIKEVLQGNDFVVNLVTLSQDTQRILARRVKDEINISGVEVTTVKDKIVLKGEVGTEDEQKRAEKIAAIYVDEKSVVNVISVNPKKANARAGRLIQVTAYFVELNKAFLRNFNFSWAPIADVSATYTNLNPDRPFSVTAVVSQFIPSLSTAKALGVARVYENPTISVKSGEQGRIRSGASIIYPNRQDNGAVTYSADSKIETGITLTVTPAVDDRDFIDIQIDVDAKKPGSSTNEGAVVVNESQVATKHYIRSGETVAIGGVMRSAFTEIKDAPPGQPFSFQPGGSSGPSFQSSLGNIFQVFKSRQSTADRNMFIVFITPEVLVSARDASKNVKEEMNLQSVEPRVAGSTGGNLE